MVKAMVSKDQSIGGLIFIVCSILAIFYFATLAFPRWLNVFGTTITNEQEVRFWIIAIPVFIAFVAIMAVGIWIGWTMATTPPPKPIEEITAKVEEKTETAEPVTEEPKEETKPSEMPTEEKKPERKRKT